MAYYLRQNVSPSPITGYQGIISMPRLLSFLLLALLLGERAAEAARMPDQQTLSPSQAQEFTATADLTEAAAAHEPTSPTEATGHARPGDSAKPGALAIDMTTSSPSLAQQLYPGHIEIIAVIDGAIQNRPTLEAARNARALLHNTPRRQLLVLPKWQRGGRVSSLNAGLSIATGEIVMALDGDTSFDNDMVVNIVRHFADPNVPAVAGSLR